MSFMRNEPAIVNDPEFIRADRSFLNVVEQAVPFFVSLALFVSFYDVKLGGYLAIAYSVSRLFYFSFYHSPKLLLGLVTVPNYFIIFGMTFASLWKGKLRIPLQSNAIFILNMCSTSPVLKMNGTSFDDCSQISGTSSRSLSYAILTKKPPSKRFPSRSASQIGQTCLAQ